TRPLAAVNVYAAAQADLATIPTNHPQPPAFSADSLKRPDHRGPSCAANFRRPAPQEAIRHSNPTYRGRETVPRGRTLRNHHSTPSESPATFPQAEIPETRPQVLWNAL